MHESCLHFSLPASCEKNEGLGTGYNPMSTDMKFASVKQAVKFCIGAGLPPDKQTSVNCQTPPPPPSNH
jgi:hypothetical protein